ncbi:hybrid-cluster NAD(P)-dependent oxidoreductase [Oceanimonas sp. MB9]|uniref:hybrid-cluster NAD(P)-dependent oxidoreductase n=1 Tax=Oceanimonas sp. MB9 TaxID=2588453 RepID=UPI0013F68F11|nr:hybrid-cluster NAD(P)-dependent oxidoreductase [Oceanimonas sp. MB9]NHI01835.1 NADH oxidoreductase HCR [Oceanimonas sp. MB9]
MNMPVLSVQERSLRWKVGQKTARCLRVIQETSDVKTFWFALENHEELDFKPGQFLTFTFLIDDREAVRCYSLSSSPTQSRQFAITVKRVPGGQVSNWLHDHLNVGDETRIMAPAGHFNCLDIVADRYLLLSGGSGITPSMSMVRWMRDTGRLGDVHFMHSARSPGDIIFHQELLRIDSQWPRFRLSLLCEEKTGEQGWAGYRGRLNADLLALLCPDFRQRKILCCGPAPYMKAVRDMLAALSFPMAQYAEESFGAPGAPAAAAESSMLAGTALTHRVHFSRSGREGQGSATDTLLDTALANGVWIPSACRTGICGSCKVRKLGGTVTMDGALALSDAERADDFILPCCAYLQDDVTLEA